ncbi:MAG TPA: 4Fe-4S binding protein [Bacteroidales bacterium]|nr:4Fe-4S binding protein [Bacteroidales bacterium]
MQRDILKIDEEKCTGCGECVPNCHEGALQVIDGKVRLVSELMCDGLGACIGHCPEDAITIEKREAQPYDEITAPAPVSAMAADTPSQLTHWPVQMHLINPNSPVYRGADLLLAADCVAFSLGSFHQTFLKNRHLAIACPKLDHGTETYIDKLVAMIDIAKVNTITVMMMEVPCCGGLLQMVRSALAKASGKVPLKAVIVSIDGKILKDEWI